MEVLTATAASTTVVSIHRRPLASSSASFRSPLRVPAASHCPTLRASLAAGSPSPFPGCPVPGSKAKRSVLTRVTPFHLETKRGRPPPDLASYLLKKRIVYVGMSLIPEVQELIAAQFLHLQNRDRGKPIYLYINSTGISSHREELGFEEGAFAVYDLMQHVKAPIFTFCVGNAWGEAALLLAAGQPGYRTALSSSSIMIRQPIRSFTGRTSDLNIAKAETTWMKKQMVKLFARHTRRSRKEIEADMLSPKYFSATEAVEYGLIDKIYNTRGPEVSDILKLTDMVSRK